MNINFIDSEGEIYGFEDVIMFSVEKIDKEHNVVATVARSPIVSDVRLISVYSSELEPYAIIVKNLLGCLSQQLISEVSPD